MAESKNIALEAYPLTRSDKIEPAKPDILSKGFNIPTDAWMKAAAVGGRANGKSYAQRAVYSMLHNDVIKKEEEKAKMSEKWMWVEGYKGTDKDMRCRGFQFELNKMYGAEEGSDVKLCESGFHLCLSLKDVFKYYPVGKGNRYFKVRALVRERDYRECTIPSPFWGIVTTDKLTSMSIEFTSELIVDEILNTYYGKDGTGVSNWPEEDKLEAINTNPDDVVKKHKITELMFLGYSLPFAQYVVEKGAFEVAKSVGSQRDLSMDMKALFILKEIHD